jgi:HAD superfamily hydrolase (TIGR01509 family)
VARLRAFLFDLDGTLVDSAAANHAAYSRALLEVGARIGPDEVSRAAAGRHWREFLPTLLRDAGVQSDPAAVARRKGELYRETLGELRINSALLSLAKSVRPFIKTVLVTTASAESAQAILGHFDLDEMFDIVITGDDVTRHKPDPQAYELALERLEVKPRECLAFEDSDVGVASAEAAGVAVVRVAFAE